MPQRVLMIGWDGADWKVLRPMLDAGELPNLAAMIERGAHGDCLSTVPSHSWCAWPSFMTAPQSGRAWRFRHPRAQARGVTAPAGHLPVDQGAHDLR